MNHEVKLTFTFDVDHDTTVGEMNNAAEQAEKAIIEALAEKWQGSSGWRFSIQGVDTVDIP